MWVAYLNLENSYGSEDGTLSLLGRALTHTDARRMYLAAVDVFDRTGKAALVDHCLRAMTRKFSAAPEVRGAALACACADVGQSAGQHARRIIPSDALSLALSPAPLSNPTLNPPPSSQVWLRALKYRLTSGDPEGARRTLDRSLQSLPAFEHVRMISQAGLLEFKQGDAGEQQRPLQQDADTSAAAAPRCLPRPAAGTAGSHLPPLLAVPSPGPDPRRARALAV